MATGTELFLAVRGRAAVDHILESLGLKYSDWNYVGNIEPEDRWEEIDKLLATAHDAAVTELGFKIVDPSQVTRGGQPVKPSKGYVFLQGPDGVVRETVRWHLDVDYDPDEMGDTEDDAIVGVSLISRYFPVFLDLLKEHGGSGDLVELTPETLRQIEVARKHIAPILPFIQDAPIIIKELHY